MEQERNTSTSGNTNRGTSYDTSGKHRSYFLTINNPTQDDINNLAAETGYVAWQYETGKSGTLHVHAVIHYKNPRVWPKKRYQTANIQVVRNLKKAIEYATKEKTRTAGPYEVNPDQRPKQGDRKDLHAIGTALVSGEMTIQDVIEQEPGKYIQYGRGIEKLIKDRYPQRSSPPYVAWIWGATGTGKTRYLFDRIEASEIYIKDGTQWWDGYRQQKAILIDDFDGRWPYKDLLRLLDRYPYQGQVKGGYVQINSPYIVITCDKHPEAIYRTTHIEEENSDENHYAQIRRRITDIIHLQ